MLSFGLYLRTRKSIKKELRKKQEHERRFRGMIDFIIGTAVLAPSLYWTAVIATSVKSAINEEDR